MKKFLLAVAAFGMLMTSCSNDDTVQGDNSSSVKFVVSTPELKTRADIADVYGTGFTANDLEYAIYECDAEGNLKSNVPNISKEVAGAFAGNALQTSFTERLVNGKHYVILFWADAAEDPYKVDWTTQSISIEDTAALKAQDEKLDAFFAKTQFTVKNGMLEQTVELKRPFAQLNVGVSDTAAAAIAGLEVEKTQVKVEAYTALNLFDGSVSGKQELTYALENVPTEVTFTDPDGNAYDIISMNYLLVNEKELNDVTFTYTDKGDAQAIPDRTFSLVPVQRNHRTFVVGDLLTTAVDVKVIILPGFDNDYIYPANIALALTEGGLFKLQDNTVLDKNYIVSKATTIDLNGYNLKYTGGGNMMILVEDGASLTITGEGNVNTGESYVASADAGGIITVEGGNFTTTGPTLFQANGGKVYISGGYFDNDCAAYGTTYMLNHVDSKKNDGLIEVTGGQFVGYNPAASQSEDPVMSFVPEGYAASIAGTTADGETIYKVQKAVPMTGLTAAPAQLYQAATLSWDAVAGAEKYVVKYNGVQVAETTATTVTTAKGGVTDAAMAKFTVEALDANGGMVGVGETPETKVFTLINRPEPAVYLANGKLIVENKELNPGEAVKSNLDLNAILLEAEVYFYKDGEAAPKYTAVGTYKDTYPSANLPLSITEKKIKNNVAGSYNTWKWNGGAATATAPEFEPGTYTIKYKAGYYPVMDARFDRTPTDRIIYDDPSKVLATMIYREGEVEAKFAVASVAPAATAEGYQAAKVTWSAIQNAASYKVFANGAEKANVQETEVVISGLTDSKTYKFVVKAYDANGNVVANGETAETEIYSLKDMPAPVVTFVNGSSLKAENLLDTPGTVVKLTLNFKKDGQVAYSASYDKDNTVFNASTQAAAGRFTQANFGSAPVGTTQTKWVWNGVEADVPTFEPGEYTVEYISECYSFIGGYWGSKSGAQPFDRVFVTEATTLMEKQTLTGTLADKIIIGFNAEAKAMVDEVVLSWNPVSATATYEIYADGNKVGETTELTYTCAATVGDHNYEVKVAGTAISSAVSAKVEFTMTNWEAPKVKFTKQADGKYEMIVDNMLTLNYGYQSGTITLKKDGQTVHTLKHTFGTTLWSWASWRRFIFSNFARESWKLDGSENEARYHNLTPGTYTIEYSIDYVVIKNAGYASAAKDYGANITWCDQASSTMICFEQGVEALLWISRGQTTGTNGSVNATGAVPYTVNKQGTFVGTYTIE